MTDSNKDAQVSALTDDALNAVLDNLSGAELRDASPDEPLAGLVHIIGIGHVSVKRLQAERARRDAA